jgi:hypothetical protein
VISCLQHPDLGAWQGGDGAVQHVARTIHVAAPGDDEKRGRDGGETIELARGGSERRGDQGHAAEGGPPDRDGGDDHRSERIAGRGDGVGAQVAGEMGESALEVALLTPASVVRSRRSADASEVEAEGRQVGIGAGLDDACHHAIVHVAPVEGVRVADGDAGARGGRQGESSLEDDAGLETECDGLFAYHGADENSPVMPRVQPTC